MDSYLFNIPAYKKAFNGIWAADENNVFVVGNDGIILQLDGIAAQPQLSFPADSSNQSGTSVSFSWSGVPYSLDHYLLKIYDDDTLEYEVASITVDYNTYYTAPGFLDNGRTYYWRIVTDDDDWAGSDPNMNGRSEVREFTNGTAWAPLLWKPRDGDVVPSVNGYVTFEWFPFEITSWYYLQVAVDSNFTDVRWENWVNNTNISIGGFTDEGKEYFWRVAPNGGQYWSYSRGFVNQ